MYDAIDGFLDDYQKDIYGEYSTTKISGIGTSNNTIEMPTTVPEMLDCMSMSNASRFVSVSETSSSAGSSQHYQVNCVSRTPLSQQLQQEQQQEKQQSAAAAQQQQQQHQNLGHTLMVPIPIGPE